MSNQEGELAVTGECQTKKVMLAVTGECQTKKVIPAVTGECQTKKVIPAVTSECQTKKLLLSHRTVSERVNCLCVLMLSLA